MRGERKGRGGERGEGMRGGEGRGEGERNKLIQLRTCIYNIQNIFNPPPQFSRLGIHVSLAVHEYVCWSGLRWVGYFTFLKLVCYAHCMIRLQCTCIYTCMMWY